MLPFQRFSSYHIIFLIVLFLTPLSCFADPSATILKISGSVEHELHLSVNDLKQFQSINAQHNEVSIANQFNGNFYFRGVPLRTLLETAVIKKENTCFKKQVDVAISVKNGTQQVALSWGEIFYRNPGTVLIAYEATPILPHRDCKACHESAIYQPIMDQYHRTVNFPKLVLTDDTYSDRCLESITEIKIFQVGIDGNAEKQKKLYSAEFTITDKKDVPFLVKNLEPSLYTQVETLQHVVGEGKGYHGTRTYSGFLLTEVLKKAGIHPNFNSVFLVSAPDDYRSVFSYGEIFYSRTNQTIMLAIRENQKQLDAGGKYFLVVPDDQMGDRWIKSVKTIKAIELKE